MELKSDSVPLKFDGKLEISSNQDLGLKELDKEQFLDAVKEHVTYYGLQSFFCLPHAGKMRSLIDNLHLFTLEDVQLEYESRLIEPSIVLDATGISETPDSRNARFRSFDKYELCDRSLSRLAVDSLVTVAFHRIIAVRFSHVEIFDLLPGQTYLTIVL